MLDVHPKHEGSALGEKKISKVKDNRGTAADGRVFFNILYCDVCPTKINDVIHDSTRLISCIKWARAFLVIIPWTAAAAEAAAGGGGRGLTPRFLFDPWSVLSVMMANGRREKTTQGRPERPRTLER